MQGNNFCTINSAATIDLCRIIVVSKELAHETRDWIVIKDTPL